MAIKIPNAGEDTMLQYILNKTSPEDLRLVLYSSNTFPAESDFANTYTPVSGGGYANANLTANSWSIVQGDPTTATHSNVEFNFTSAVGSIYGYYIVRDTSEDLMWAERFNVAPLEVLTSGDRITVTPKFTGE